MDIHRQNNVLLGGFGLTDIDGPLQLLHKYRNPWISSLSLASRTIRVTSRRSSIRRASRSTLLRMVVRSSRNCPSGRLGSFSSRVVRSNAGVKGVRSSCERTARNWSLAALAALAAARSRSFSSAARAKSSARAWMATSAILRCVISRTFFEIPTLRPLASRTGVMVSDTSMSRPLLGQSHRLEMVQRLSKPNPLNDLPCLFLAQGRQV